MQAPVRDLVHRERVRLVRMVANAERDDTERYWSAAVADWYQDGAKAPGRPRHIGLDATAELSPVTPLRVAGHESVARQPAKLLDVAAQSRERLRTTCTGACEILSEGQLVEADREDRPVPHHCGVSALAVAWEVPEVADELLAGQTSLAMALKNRIYRSVVRDLVDDDDARASHLRLAERVYLAMQLLTRGHRLNSNVGRSA